MLNRSLEQCKEKYLAFEKCKIMTRQKESNIWYFRITLFLPKSLPLCP